MAMVMGTEAMDMVVMAMVSTAMDITKTLKNHHSGSALKNDFVDKLKFSVILNET